MTLGTPQSSLRNFHPISMLHPACSPQDPLVFTWSQTAVTVFTERGTEREGGWHPKEMMRQERLTGGKTLEWKRKRRWREHLSEERAKKNKRPCQGWLFRLSAENAAATHTHKNARFKGQTIRTWNSADVCTCACGRVEYAAWKSLLFTPFGALAVCRFAVSLQYYLNE